jgi:hypothetical protein
MAEIKLKREDWQDARDQAERILRQTEISRIVNENLFNIAEAALKGFPDEEPTNKTKSETMNGVG